MRWTYISYVILRRNRPTEVILFEEYEVGIYDLGDTPT